VTEEIPVQRSINGHRAHLRTIEGSSEPEDLGVEVREYQSRKSPYPAVNERRRKREYNRRSTAQLNRQRRERPEAARREMERAAYKSWLRANAAEILAEAKSERAA
jgi:hypothetical protein